MAYHLLNDYDMALQILEEFRKTQSSADIKPFDYEHGEMLLYQNMVLMDAGRDEDALKHLDKHKNETVDKLAVEEVRGKLQLKLGHTEEAADIYRKLLDRNPENCAYYEGLEQSSRLATLEGRVQIYKDAELKFPKALAPKRLLLNIVTGEQFRTEADRFLVNALRKGVPPLFRNLRSLYTDKEKVRILEELTLGYVESLQSCELFHPNDDAEEEGKESPTSLLWTYYYLAQHYDQLRNTAQALHYINTALEHTMTLIELYIVKAKIYKHAGDIQEAVKCLDEAQSLDTADRYINSKCAKYKLRASMISEAEQMCAKFTREGISATENLHEMQCMWFQIECASAYQRMGKYGEALKKCHEIDRHFTEIIEDQFDFHTYCMRKMTLRSYVELLRLEDVLRNHPFYFSAARIAIEIYIRLHDNPASESNANKEFDQENLSPAEQKKLRNKQRRKDVQEALKKEKLKQEEQQRQSQNKSKSQDPEVEGPKEEELVPDKLVKAEHPLDEAIKFLKPLQQLAAKRMETHFMSFKIYFRKGKLLLMLQSLKRGYAIDKDCPQLHEFRMSFLQLVRERKSQLSEVVERVIEQGLKDIFPDGCTDASQLNETFLKQHADSLSHVLSGAKVKYALNASTQSDCLNLISSLSTNLNDSRDNIVICGAVLEALTSGAFGACETFAAEYRAQCHERFPHAAVFAPKLPNGIAKPSCDENDETTSAKEISDGMS